MEAMIEKSSEKQVKMIHSNTDFETWMKLDKTDHPKKVFIIYFFADWCHYCKEFTPHFAEIWKYISLMDKKKELTVCMISDEYTPPIAKSLKYTFKGVPTVLAYQIENGRPILVSEDIRQNDAKAMAQTLLKLVPKAEVREEKEDFVLKIHPPTGKLKYYFDPTRPFNEIHQACLSVIAELKTKHKVDNVTIIEKNNLPMNPYLIMIPTNSTSASDIFPTSGVDALAYLLQFLFFPF